MAGHVDNEERQRQERRRIEIDLADAVRDALALGNALVAEISQNERRLDPVPTERSRPDPELIMTLASRYADALRRRAMAQSRI